MEVADAGQMDNLEKCLSNVVHRRQRRQCKLSASIILVGYLADELLRGQNYKAERKCPLMQ